MIENKKKLSALEKINDHDNKIRNLITTMNKFCSSSSDITKQNLDKIKTLQGELSEMKQERCDTNKLCNITEKFHDNYEKQTGMLSDVKKTLGQIYEMMKVEGNAQDNDTDTMNWRNEVAEMIEKKFTNFKQNEENKNEGQTINSLANNVTEALKFEIVNKGGNMRREYKMDNNSKFEHFYDYFSSELRSHGLTNVIDKEIESRVDAKTLEEQKFKVRDILINHLDRNYHSKVTQLQDPAEIINKLKEIKSCETNATSHSVRKQLYTMKYVIGKETAIQFCERFKETIRTYENSPGGK